MSRAEVVRNDAGELCGVHFDCPGCEGGGHMVMVAPWLDGDVESPDYVPKPHWGFNGNLDLPTFTPSVLSRYTWGPEKREVVCHSFVTDGKIQFLGDCTHALAGQTVDLPEIDE